MRFPIFICYEVKSFTGKNKHITELKKEYSKDLSLEMYLVKPAELKEGGG